VEIHQLFGILVVIGHKENRMKPEHRKGEMPDSLYLLIEEFVGKVFNELKLELLIY